MGRDWIDDKFENIVNTIREPLLMLDSDLTIIFANRSFIEAFRVSQEQTLGCFIYDLGNGQWDIPQLKQLLEDVLQKNRSFSRHNSFYDLDGCLRGRCGFDRYPSFYLRSSIRIAKKTDERQYGWWRCSSFY